MWEIRISKQADKFMKQNNIKDEEIVELVKKLINFLKGEEENIDIKKLKGDWKGYYRVKRGKKRIILKLDFDIKIVFIDKIDFRGDAYK